MDQSVPCIFAPLPNERPRSHHTSKAEEGCERRKGDRGTPDIRGFHACHWPIKERGIDTSPLRELRFYLGLLRIRRGCDLFVKGEDMRKAMVVCVFFCCMSIFVGCPPRQTYVPRPEPKETWSYSSISNPIINNDYTISIPTTKHSQINDWQIRLTLLLVFQKQEQEVGHDTRKSCLWW